MALSPVTHRTFRTPNAVAPMISLCKLPRERLRADIISSLARTYRLADAAIAECLDDVLQDNGGSVSLLRLIRERLRRGKLPTETQERRRHIA